MDRHSLDKKKTLRSAKDLAKMVVRIAQAAPADVIICTTETGALAFQVHSLSQQVPVIAATTNAETYDTLTEKGLETVRLPICKIYIRCGYRPSSDGNAAEGPLCRHKA